MFKYFCCKILKAKVLLWPLSLSRSFYLLCLAKGVFSPVPPYNGYFQFCPLSFSCYRVCLPRFTSLIFVYCKPVTTAISLLNIKLILFESEPLRCGTIPNTPQPKPNNKSIRWCHQCVFLSVFLQNFFLCQDCWHGDVPPNLAQPCSVTLGWVSYIGLQHQQPPTNTNKPPML